MDIKTLQKLYDSEINFSISCFWDGGIDVKLGDSMNGFDAKNCCNTVKEGIDFLAEQAKKHYPQSKFALETWHNNANGNDFEDVRKI